MRRQKTKEGKVDKGSGARNSGGIEIEGLMAQIWWKWQYDWLDGLGLAPGSASKAMNSSDKDIHKSATNHSRSELGPSTEGTGGIWLNNRS